VVVVVDEEEGEVMLVIFWTRESSDGRNDMVVGECNYSQMVDDETRYVYVYVCVCVW